MLDNGVVPGNCLLTNIVTTIHGMAAGKFTVTQYSKIPMYEYYQSNSINLADFTLQNTITQTDTMDYCKMSIPQFDTTEGIILSY